MTLETLSLLVGMGLAAVGIVMSAHGCRMHWLASEWQKRADAARKGCANHRQQANGEVNKLVNDYRALELLYNELQNRHAEVVTRCKVNADQIVQLNRGLDMAWTQRNNIEAERDNLKNKVAELTDRIGVQFANLTETENERAAVQRVVDNQSRMLEELREECKIRATDRDALTKELHIVQEELADASESHYRKAIAERDEKIKNLESANAIYFRRVKYALDSVSELGGRLTSCLDAVSKPKEDPSKPAAAAMSQDYLEGWDKLKAFVMQYGPLKSEVGDLARDGDGVLRRLTVDSHGDYFWERV